MCVCVSLGTRKPVSLYIGPLFVSLIHIWESQDNDALRLHAIGPAARLAPSGGVTPLLVPLCYNFTGPTWTRRLQVLSLMRTSASQSGTTQASVRRTYWGLLSHHLCDRLLSRYTVPHSCEGARTHQTCEVLGDTGGRLRVRPIKTSRPLNVLPSPRHVAWRLGGEASQPPKYLY